MITKRFFAHSSAKRDNYVRLQSTFFHAKTSERRDVLTSSRLNDESVMARCLMSNRSRRKAFPRGSLGAHVSYY